MKALILGLTIALGSLASSASHACEGKEKVKQVTVTDASQMTKAGTATFVDANNPATRQKFGVIPGALLLTSATEYDAAKELTAPKDRKLVFYCANTHCGASEMAAKRAQMAGYTDVQVLPAGIMGWKDAGLPTQKGAEGSAKRGES